MIAMNREGNSNDDNREDGGGGSGAGAANDDALAASDVESEGELYDIALAAVHSYMSAGMMPVRGRTLLDAGWQGRVPAVFHHGYVFPGETVPMLMPHAEDAILIAQAIRTDKLFALLSPDESGNNLSGYGVLCEVYEAGMEEELNSAPAFNTLKARAIYRIRFAQMPKAPVPIYIHARMKFVDVRVLPEVATSDTLSSLPMHSLAPLQDHHSPARRRAARRLEASATPWPQFVHDIFDYPSAIKAIKEYLTSIRMDFMPEDPVMLSFIVASNLVLSARDNLELFVEDNALRRLKMEVEFINRTNVLCCLTCQTDVAQRKHIFPMSSDGVHATYVNLGGYMHDLLTVREARNVRALDYPTDEYSWFPGYGWSTAECAHCSEHIGWRFDALKPTLRPQQFYGLCRPNIQPYRGPVREPPSLDEA